MLGFTTLNKLGLSLQLSLDVYQVYMEQVADELELTSTQRTTVATLTADTHVYEAKLARLKAENAFNKAASGDTSDDDIEDNFDDIIIDVEPYEGPNADGFGTVY